MKKLMLMFMVFSLLAGLSLAYTVSGTVYYSGTNTPVPGASVALRVTQAGGGASAGYTATADAFGAFSMGWPNMNYKGYTVKLTATNPTNTASGSVNWTAQVNIESKNVPISSIVQPADMDMYGMPAHWVGAVGTVVSNVVLQATPNPVPQVANANINIFFNAPVIGVNNVVPANASDTLTWSVPAPGQLQVQVQLNPPRDVPDFPAESFFDVFYEVDMPGADEGVLLGLVGVESAEFEDGGGVIHLAVANTTENLLGHPPEPCKSRFFIDSQDEWETPLNADWPRENIIPMTAAEWNNPDWGYMAQWGDYLEAGDPYPPTTEYLPPELYVYPGDGDEGNPDPDDAGLVMQWGGDTTPDGEYAAAWKYDYGLDPDLSNCIITVTATPPAGIANISLGLQDNNGNIRSWHWTCGPSGVLPSGVPTTIKIDTTKTGLSAASPTATGYANNPLFDLTKVQFIIADENANWVAQQGAVPPGGTIPAIWNYWHNLSVTTKTTAYKGNYVKFSQPPEVVEDGMIYGWDVKSVFPWNYDQGMTWTWAADDWKCYDERPVTDVHWWGSFIGWTQPYLPPQVPDYFLMAIWKDVPADASGSSHPKELLWLHQCDNWVWNYAGYDKDPRFEFGEYNVELFGEPQENEACFQFNQLLSEDDWFYQEPMEVLPDGTVIPNVYWFSIAAVYENTDISQIEYPWGWKTKPFDETKAPDPAVVITDLDMGTPPWDTLTGTTTGHITEVASWFSLILPDPSAYPNGQWWDLAFELTTNEPKCPGLKADLNGDCVVNLPDFAIMADDWLKEWP